MARHSARGRAWAAVRAAALRRAQHRCERCGRAGKLEVHHKVALADGGPRFALDNLEVVCRPCHFDEHKPAPDPEREEWRALINGV